MSFSKWFAAHKGELKPPVANRLMYENALKVMVVGGPNQRTDYHLQRGEELFWQLEGTAVVNVVQQNGAVKRSVRLPPGYVWLLPASVPHNPTREAGSVGFVFERERALSELDAVQWCVHACARVCVCVHTRASGARAGWRSGFIWRWRVGFVQDVPSPAMCALCVCVRCLSVRVCVCVRACVRVCVLACVRVRVVFSLCVLAWW